MSTCHDNDDFAAKSKRQTKKKLANSSGVMKRDQSANRKPQSSIEIVVYREERERDRESDTITDVILFRRKNENKKRKNGGGKR